VVERVDDKRPGRILSNVVLSQVNEHAAFGGVVPEIAARAHVEALDHVISKALADAGRTFEGIDGIAAAAGPGLIGGVIVGLTTAKAIALVNEKPLIAVNHLEGHALTARLTDATPFPYCLFLASGGHTQIVAVRGIADYVLLGTPSTTPSERRSTRPRNFSGWVIRAVRRSKGGRAGQSATFRISAAHDRAAGAEIFRSRD
jgi:N6-L-threonylcarbamoyladenine synthase